jgi:hypothetical protein
MHILKRLLVLSLILTANVAWGAGPVPQLIVNCIPDTQPPPSNSSVCFGKQEGVPFTFWVLAVNSNYQVMTNYTGTVHITSDDPTATLPGDHTFTVGDGGIAAFVMTFHSVTTASVPSPQIVTASDAQNRLSGFTAFFVSKPAISQAPLLGFTSATLLTGLLVLAAFRASRRFKAKLSI